MKNKKRTDNVVGIVCIGLGFLLLCAVPASAAEGASPSWRPTYDVIMMWVNSLILFGVLYKFLKNPFLDFIHQKKMETEKDLQRAEDQKVMAETKIKESKQMLEEGEDRFKKIKERIIAQGEARKAQIIEEAKEQSQYMMTEATRKIDSYIIRARKKFREEMIDIAFEKALEKIPEVITEEDGERFVQDYIHKGLA